MDLISRYAESRNMVYSPVGQASPLGTYKPCGSYKGIPLSKIAQSVQFRSYRIVPRRRRSLRVSIKIEVSYLVRIQPHNGFQKHQMSSFLPLRLRYIYTLRTDIPGSRNCLSLRSALVKLDHPAAGRREQPGRSGQRAGLDVVRGIPPSVGYQRNDSALACVHGRHGKQSRIRASHQMGGTTLFHLPRMLPADFVDRGRQRNQPRPTPLPRNGAQRGPGLLSLAARPDRPQIAQNHLSRQKTPHNSSREIHFARNREIRTDPSSSEAPPPPCSNTPLSANLSQILTTLALQASNLRFRRVESPILLFSRTYSPTGLP